MTFRRNLVRQLIGTFMSRKRTGWKRIMPNGTALGNAVPMGKLLFFSILYEKYQAMQKCVLCV